MISKRTSATQLPDIKEIEAILEREAKRPVPAIKEKIHYASFELFYSWLELTGISSGKFKTTKDWKEVILLGGEAQLQVVSETLNLIKANNPSVLKLMKDITDYLGESDQPKKSDLIFVYGSSNIGRMETAVSLFKQGHAPCIFISGGAPVYNHDSESEAQVFRSYAIKNGVPESNIFLHDKAITIADNVRGGLNVIDQLHLSYNSMILVTSWFAMRRSWVTMMKYVDVDINLYRVNSGLASSSLLNPETWYLNETGIKIVFNEFGKMKMSELINSS